MVAGYSASNTEFSEHSLKKYSKTFFFKSVSSFLRAVMKRSKQKNREFAEFFIEFLKPLIVKTALKILKLTLFD